MSIDASPAPEILPADPPSDPDEAVVAFLEWTQARGLTLYPHQEEALLELATGANVVLATPTGSGKSLAALAALNLLRYRTHGADYIDAYLRRHTPYYGD